MKNLFLTLVILLITTNPLKAVDVTANPILTVHTLDGKNFNLKEQLGKVVIVNFWAKWCSICRQEIQALEEIYQKYKTQGLEVIAINIDQKSQRKKVAEITASFSYSSAMFYEIQEGNFEEPEIIPTSYIIDQSGKIAAKIIGKNEDDFDKRNLEEIVQSLLTSHHP